MIKIDEILKIKAPSLRGAITIYFQEAIASGKLPAGYCLPSSRELAEKLNTSYPNVHQALVPLVKSGLLLRDRKKGTIVREQKKELKCVAIYVYRTNIDDMPQYQHVLIDQIQKQLADMGIDTRLVLDNESFFCVDQLKQWAQMNEIQGIIVPIGGKALCQGNKQLKSLPVPLITTDNVTVNLTRLVSMAVKRLKKEGCQKIAMLSTVEYCRKNKDDNLEETKFYRDFFNEMNKSGLTIDTDLIATPENNKDYFHTADKITNFAFEKCNELLELPEEKRPDGLFVFPDQLTTGVMLSVMKNGINIPDEMKLVIHRNWEINVPIFTPCSMVGISVAENAERIIDNLIKSFNGLKPQKYKINPEIKVLP